MGEMADDALDRALAEVDDDDLDFYYDWQPRFFVPPPPPPLPPPVTADDIIKQIGRLRDD